MKKIKENMNFENVLYYVSISILILCTLSSIFFEKEYLFISMLALFGLAVARIIRNVGKTK